MTFGSAPSAIFSTLTFKFTLFLLLFLLLFSGISKFLGVDLVALCLFFLLIYFTHERIIPNFLCLVKITIGVVGILSLGL